MPTEKVGCTFITCHLKQFLEDYPSSSEKQVFLDIYHRVLSLLDKYLYDHLKQHTHCMSSDNEYVTLIQYAIRLHIDLTTFPTLWAVLFILLDTQDGKHEYVKCLQGEYNTTTKINPEDTCWLERQSVELQNCMYDSVTHNFDRVSGLHDNGLTPLRIQEGNQPVEATTPENAIDDAVIDIMTIYPPWSTDINDLNDINQMTNYKSMKVIRDEICKDMPQKTNINKSYIDNIDAYNRERQLITTSLSNRLDLGQNSLPGAQQVRVAVKHTDQTSEFPEHLT